MIIIYIDHNHILVKKSIKYYKPYKFLQAINKVYSLKIL